MNKENVVRYEEVGGGSFDSESQTTYVKYSELIPDTVFEGTYNGSHLGNFDKTTYFLKQEDGNVLGFNATGKLTYLINKAELTIGQPIRITYLGKSVVSKGPNAGKPAHDFKLAVGVKA